MIDGAGLKSMGIRGFSKRESRTDKDPAVVFISGYQAQLPRVELVESEKKKPR